jgi:hypothetical protein
MKRLSMLAALLFWLAPASAGISLIFLPVDFQDLLNQAEGNGAVSLERAVDEMTAIEIDLPTKQKAGKNMQLVGGEQSAFVDFGSYVAPATLFHLSKDPAPPRIQVNSYLLKPQKGRKAILFPHVHALTRDGVVLAQLEPLDASMARGNTISNYYKLPARTRFLLIHSHPSTVTWVGSEREEPVADGMRIGTLGALGGAFGGAFAAALDNFRVERGKADLIPVGAIELFADDA